MTIPVCVWMSPSHTQWRMGWISPGHFFLLLAVFFWRGNFKITRHVTPNKILNWAASFPLFFSRERERREIRTCRIGTHDREKKKKNKKKRGIKNNTYRTTITGSALGAVNNTDAAGRRHRRCRLSVLDVQQGHVALAVVANPIAQALKVNF